MAWRSLLPLYLFATGPRAGLPLCTAGSRGNSQSLHTPLPARLPPRNPSGLPAQPGHAANAVAGRRTTAARPAPATAEKGRTTRGTPANCELPRWPRCPMRAIGMGAAPAKARRAPRPPPPLSRWQAQQAHPALPPSAAAGCGRCPAKCKSARPERASRNGRSPARPSPNRPTVFAQSDAARWTTAPRGWCSRFLHWRFG